MKLFLASEAKHPQCLEKMKTFVGGFEGKKIAYIPTAANGELYGSWKQGGSIQVVQTLGALVEVVQLEDCVYRDVLKPIQEADVIWMAGGQVGYLMYWIRRVELDKALPEIVDKGAIYIGSSAGSMVCAPTLDLAEWYIGEREPGTSNLPGLGLVNFDIYPHYEDELLPEIEKMWTVGKLYLLKNGEAITVVNEKVEVLGEERIIQK